jgi:hypothetical protein
LLQLGCHRACCFETGSPLGLLLASCRRNLAAAGVSACRDFNLVALQRNADGVAVRSFPGTKPETNVPAQVPLWQWLGPIRFPHPRTPPIAPQVPTVDSVAKPCRGLPGRRPAQLAVSELLLRYADAILVQVSKSAVCNCLHPVPKCYTRWLLMAHDRLGSDRLPLTLKFLSFMLTVRLASVSEATSVLQRAGLAKKAKKKGDAALFPFGFPTRIDQPHQRLKLTRRIPGVDSSVSEPYGRQRGAVDGFWGRFSARC